MEPLPSPGTKPHLNPQTTDPPTPVSGTASPIHPSSSTQSLASSSSHNSSDPLSPATGSDGDDGGCSCGSLVEALDREAARMHAANYLARARDRLVQDIQAQAASFLPNPTAAAPPLTQEENPQDQSQWQSQGLSSTPMVSGERGKNGDRDEQQQRVYEGRQEGGGVEENKERYHGKQEWEREGKWEGDGSLGSMGGIGFAVEGSMTGVRGEEEGVG
ncbi:MAG: hypothetical protein LQ338_001063 [Usnochroma carphineum]|nr:MAG: hypothetical protein LQ338_001063 [Usnochroma carphineum]